MTPFDAIVRTPFAMIGIRSDLRAVSGVEYLRDDPPAMEPTNRLAARAVREIERYLDDPEYRFTVPLAVAGTPFQQRVRQAIAGIPVGESRTYAEIARAVRSSARAVGGACGRNRIALIVPCHRVVGSCGALGGFMNAAGGEPVAIKRWLLTHEGYRFGT